MPALCSARGLPTPAELADSRRQPDAAERAARAQEAVQVALRAGATSGALCAAAAVGVHLVLRAFAPVAYGAPALAPLRRIAGTVLVLGGTWFGANAGYAKAAIRWNAE